MCELNQHDYAWIYKSSANISIEQFARKQSRSQIMKSCTLVLTFLKSDVRSYQGAKREGPEMFVSEFQHPV